MTTRERRSLRVAAIAAGVLALGWLVGSRACDRDASGTEDAAPVATERARTGSLAPRAPRTLRGRFPAIVPAIDHADLHGKVIRPDGTPVPEATVRLLERPGVAPEVELDELVTAADERGQFAFERQITGRYQIEAQHEDMVSAAVSHHLSRRSSPVTLVLFPGATVAVEVVRASDGRPIEGAEVGIWSGDPEFGDPSVQRTETTDAGGIARFPGITATANHAVYARADGHVDGYTNMIAAGHPDRERWQTRIALERAASLRGRVVDTRGAPVAGATVGFAPARQTELPDGIMSPFLRAGRVGTTTTDETGAFELDAEPGTGCATATAPGYVMGEQCGVSVTDGRPTSGVTITLEDGGTIAGVVVDGDGVRVPAANVLITRRGEDIEPMFAQNYRFETRTDAQGRFRFTGVDRVPVVVYAYTEEASSELVDVDLTAEAENLGVQIPLEHEGVITGVVIEEDATPVPYATVVYRPDSLADERGFESEDTIGKHDGPPPRWTMTRTKGATRCDAEGRFEIRGLAAGAYRLIASRPERTSTSPSYGTVSERGIFVGSDATLVLPALRELRGRVVTEDGSPVAHFGISLGVGSGPFNTRRFPPPTVFHAGDGRFVLEEIPAGHYRLQVSAPGFQSTYLAPFEVGDEDVDLGTIEVPEGVERTGIVLGPDGEPVAGARVTLAANGIETNRESDPDGRFSPPTLAPEAKLRARATTDTASSEWVTVGPDQTEIELTLSGEATGSLTGALVAPGQPIEGRVIAVTANGTAPDEARPAAIARTEAGGLFEVETLPAGTYQLWLHRPPGPVEELDEQGIPMWTEHPKPVEIRPGQVTDVAVVSNPNR